ncbi:hypothetical protein [Actinokineospora cianjurensis]|uniref:Trypsin-like peptidase n=1 Tax=Actinokineospora cianjurensis TaxID=585224 RepID=A0A421B3B7_9PSEU|nr:hypothetical protein [Actinokineospora cianjurensis]RLK58768.1 hypothetical protein CLV68_3243 [Actinokineospora cianjurensis]
MIGVRRIALASAMGVVSLLVAVGPAGAVGNGVDPGTTVIREPVSGRAVDDWKLAGRASASGVQVAPQWVLTTRHAPGSVGGSFTNAYGTARIDSVTSCPGSNCDLSLSHLAVALPAPAFVDLVDNGIPRVDNTLAGSALAVGMGGGKLTAGWTSPTGGLMLSTLVNPPTAIPGDSGGPVFYHRPGDINGHLFGLMTYASTGVISGVPQFTAEAKTFISGVVGTAVRWTTFEQLGPRPQLPAAITDFTASATQNSIRMDWKPVPAVTAYTAVLINPDNPADRELVRTNATTATFAVPAGVRWGAFVLPETANGQALVPAGMDTMGSTITYRYFRYVAAGPPPTPVRNVTVESTSTGFTVVWERGPEALPEVNDTEVRVCVPSDILCGRPILRVNSEQPGVDITVPGVAYGDRFILALTDHNPSGTAAQAVVPVTHLPLLPPTAARSLSAHVTDTKITFGYDSRGDDPVTMVPLGRYRQHAPADVYLVSFIDLQGRKRTLPVVNPATQPTFDVNPVTSRLTPGRYDFTLTPHSWTWGDGKPITLSVQIGTPGDYSVAAKVPPAPVFTGANPITWTQPAPTANQSGVDTYLLVELVSGQVYELGPDVRDFDPFSAHLQRDQQWRVIAANYEYGQSLPTTAAPIEVLGD